MKEKRTATLIKITQLHIPELNTSDNHFFIYLDNVKYDRYYLL